MAKISRKRLYVALEDVVIDVSCYCGDGVYSAKPGSVPPAKATLR